MKLTPDGPMGLYYEEFEEGATMVTRGRTITEADIVQFAALTGDFNPMHTDEQYAQSTQFGKRIAHGMLPLSYAVGQAYQLGFLERTILAFRSLEMKFSQPVVIGDTLRVEITVKEKGRVIARLGGGPITLEVRILNQRDGTVQKGEWVILMATKPAGEA